VGPNTSLTRQVGCFDNMCLHRIFRIPYTDHVTNSTVCLRAGSPPQLSQLIRSRWLWTRRSMDTSVDITRALKVSIRGLFKDLRRPPGRPCHTWLRTLVQISSLTTLASTQHGNTLKIENIGSTTWKPLRSSSGHARDDDL